MKPVKTISAHTHAKPQCGRKQLADTRPGNYYVTCRDGNQTGFLAGPFNSHPEALAQVERVRTEACRVNSWAAFYAFGTCRMVDSYRKPGLLNKILGI